MLWVLCLFLSPLDAQSLLCDYLSEPSASALFSTDLQCPRTDFSFCPGSIGNCVSCIGYGGYSAVPFLGDGICTAPASCQFLEIPFAFSARLNCSSQSVNVSGLYIGTPNFTFMPSLWGFNNIGDIQIQTARLLGGTISSEIGTLSQLTRFSFTLASNYLQPTLLSVPLQLPTEIGLLSNLAMWSTMFLMPSIPTEIGRLTRLTSLLMMTSSPLPTEIGMLTSLEVMQIWVMDNANIQLIPTEIASLARLSTLVVTHLSLTTRNSLGTIPTELGMLQSLNYLSLAGNFVGTMPTELGLLLNATGIVIDAPSLSGPLPTLSLGSPLSQLQWLQLNTQLSGTIPSAFSRLSILEITGGSFASIPTSWALGGNFLILILRNCSLSGTIPAILSRPTIGSYVQTFDLSNNRLTGVIPPIWGNPSFFQALDLILSNNLLTGTLPAIRIGQSLRVDHNRLSGTVPLLSKIINAYITVDIVLDFSFTQLTLPRDSGWYSFNDLGPRLAEIYMQDTLLDYFPAYLIDPILTNLKTLVLSNNQVTGILPFLEIPPKLTKFDFSWNFLEGNLSFALPLNASIAINATVNRLSLNSSLYFPPGPPLFNYTISFLPQDVDECALGTHNCANACVDGWFPRFSYTCGCNAFEATAADGSCLPCASNWEFFPISSNANLFPNFRRLGYNVSSFQFSACSLCSGGFLVMQRNIVPHPSCVGLASSNVSSCVFACSNETSFSAARESLFYIKQQLGNGFLYDILVTLFDLRLTNLTFSERKRPVTAGLDFVIACNGNTTAIAPSALVIEALVNDITPNLASSQFTSTMGPTGECLVTLTATDPDQVVSGNLPTGAIIGIVVAAVIFVLLGILLVLALFMKYYYYQSELHALPEAISWSFFDQVLHPWNWDSSSGFKHREYVQNSEEWNRVTQLLDAFFDGANLQPTAIMAVYNKTLATSFVNQLLITRSRKINSPEHFFATTYRKDPAKLSVIKVFDNLAASLPWNNDLILPIIPALHGTDYFIARAISETGFAALSSLDAGYFGKGIYFTTFLKYTLPYALGKSSPAVILSYINMGNVFPVTEDHKGPKTLIGAALKPGYNSHFVVTKKDGCVSNQTQLESEDTLCNEIVVGQESQILPAFIISLDVDSCNAEFNNWNREIPPTNKSEMKSKDVAIPLETEFATATPVVSKKSSSRFSTLSFQNAQAEWV